MYRRKDQDFAMLHFRLAQAVGEVADVEPLLTPPVRIDRFRVPKGGSERVWRSALQPRHREDSRPS